MMADIPGYYYDEKKKRYFRSPPKHLAYMMSDTPSRRAKCTSHNSQHSPSQLCTHSRLSSTLASAIPPLSMFDLTSRVSRLFHDPTSTLRYALPQTVVCSFRKQQLEDSIAKIACMNDPFPKVSHVVLNQTGQLVVSSMQLSSEIKRIYVLEVYPIGCENRVKVLPVAIGRTPSYHVSNSPMLGPDICVTPFGESEIVMRFDKSGLCVVSVYKHISIDNDTMSTHWLNSGIYSIVLPNVKEQRSSLACATLPDRVLGAMSTTNSKIHISELPQSREIQTYTMPEKTSVWSLLFRQSPLLLHAGTRSGRIATWDLRSKKRISSTAVPNDSHDRANPSVIQMHVLDNNYLIANCLCSKLLLWDCRMNRQVISYPKHTNAYYPCRSCVDESQSVLAAVGDDKVIRMWSVWKGTLLRTIPETEYVTDDRLFDRELPAIAYNQHLGGPGGTPGLLIETHEGFTPFTV